MNRDNRKNQKGCGGKFPPRFRGNSEHSERHRGRAHLGSEAEGVATLEVNEMTLMRAFSKVDKEGKIQLPGNIQRVADLKEGQLVELKIVGASRKKNILVSAKENAR